MDKRETIEVLRASLSRQEDQHGSNKCWNKTNPAVTRIGSMSEEEEDTVRVYRCDELTEKKKKIVRIQESGRAKKSQAEPRDCAAK